MFVVQTQNLSRIQFTRHFIEFVVVEMKRFVGSNVNVILSRQTCRQRLSMSAGSKRRALAFIFFVRIWYAFSESKCRRESDLGLCTTSGLIIRMMLCSANFRQISWPNTFLIGSRHRAAAFFWHVKSQKECESRSCAQT